LGREGGIVNLTGHVYTVKKQQKCMGEGKSTEHFVKVEKSKMETGRV